MIYINIMNHQSKQEVFSTETKHFISEHNPSLGCIAVELVEKPTDEYVRMTNGLTIEQDIEQQWTDFTEDIGHIGHITFTDFIKEINNKGKYKATRFQLRNVMNWGKV